MNEDMPKKNDIIKLYTIKLQGMTLVNVSEQ